MSVRNKWEETKRVLGRSWYPIPPRLEVWFARALLWWFIGFLWLAATDKEPGGRSVIATLGLSAILGAIVWRLFLWLYSGALQYRAERAPVVETNPRSHLRTHLNVRNYVLLLVTVMVVAVAYYFLFSLPAHNRAFLALEQQKYLESAVARDLEGLRAGTRDRLFASCAEEADSDYWKYIMLNGGKTIRDGESSSTIRAPHWAMDRALQKKRAELEECSRKYGR